MWPKCQRRPSGLITHQFQLICLPSVEECFWDMPHLNCEVRLHQITIMSGIFHSLKEVWPVQVGSCLLHFNSRDRLQLSLPMSLKKSYWKWKTRIIQYYQHTITGFGSTLAMCICFFWSVVAEVAKVQYSTTDTTVKKNISITYFCSKLTEPCSILM